MTDKTLPSLSLDDIRVAEPDRDTAEAFNPSETWATACERVKEGYSAEDVAGLLLDLEDDEFRELREFWTGEDDPDPGARAWTLADMGKPEFLLSAALNVAGADWPMPLMEADEVIALQAENAKLRELLAEARDLVAEWEENHVYDAQNGDDPDPEDAGPRLRAAIDAALAGHEASLPPQPKPVRVVISVEGGMVTGLSADGPVAAVITDYDTENSDEADLTDIPGTGMGGPPARAGIEFIAAECDPAFVAAVHALDPDGGADGSQEGTR